MKILINTPDLSLSGGVANHYKGLRTYWTDDVVYNYVGGRKSFSGVVILPFDYFKFVYLCVFGGFQVILLNPSLGKTALKRDALFLKIAKLFKIKTVIFFHGWDLNMEKNIDKSPIQFIKEYNKASSIIVLGSIFRIKLQEWGITVPINLSTTKFDNKLIKGFDINKKKPNKTILFLARVEENKGIFIVLNAFKYLSEQNKTFKLKIAGDGSALDSAKQFVKSNELSNIEFLGNVSGEELVRAFSESSIYVLPTTHGEGMPTSVLEAMAFGLPVITRPVGGIVDFFEENKMGYLVESLDPIVYADLIEYLLNNDKKTQMISKYNHNYAISNFEASKVSINIENILKNCNG